MCEQAWQTTALPCPPLRLAVQEGGGPPASGH